jgi:phospholipid/cholesterol/gamma-HCH transport system permease protein
MRAISKLGETVWLQWDEVRHAAAVIGTVLCRSIQPRYWARTVRHFFTRQVLAVGVQPLGFVCVVAAFVGLSVVVQLAFWTGQTGQSQLLGPLLVTVVARELGPLLTNIIVIVRSSSAMATEPGVLKINGEIPLITVV